MTRTKCRPNVRSDKWSGGWSAVCSGCSWFTLEGSWEAAFTAAVRHCADVVNSVEAAADSTDRLWNRWAGAWSALCDIEGELYGDEPVTAERREYLRACQAKFSSDVEQVEATVENETLTGFARAFWGAP